MNSKEKEMEMPKPQFLYWAAEQNCLLLRRSWGYVCFDFKSGRLIPFLGRERVASH